VELGPSVRVVGSGGPLTDLDLALDTREAVQRILDEATPPRWLLGG
jgi:hypothetical protein